QKVFLLFSDPVIMDIPSTSSGHVSKCSRKQTVQFGDENFERRVTEWYLESDDELEENEEIDDSDIDPDYVLSDDEQQATQEEVEISEGSESDTEDNLLNAE
ncbi:MAG: hypothetical protein KTM48_01135, partial [Wolbachia endosymbiont of Pissodes strobi]|nr:hypothetical protein [Wolbachia endosymbiont of Pissodes strobi]